MARQRKEKKGAFMCGKCGDDFPTAHGLGIHVVRAHDSARKARKPKARKALRSKPARKPARRPSRATSSKDWKCQKCGLDEFKSVFSFAAHRRYCKAGPIPRIEKNSFSGPSLTSALLSSGRKKPDLVFDAATKAASNGQNPIERLRNLAADKRREAAEIDTFVASFEAGAQKLLE